MNLEETKKNWEENFRKSPLVRYGKYNQNAACQLFWNSNPCIRDRFQRGFRYFHDHYGVANPIKKLDLLVDYLDYIGIKIRKEAILEAVESNATSLPEILTKCFFLLRSLAIHRGSFDIMDPFKKAHDHIQFLLELDAGMLPKKRRLKFLGRRPVL